MNAGHPARIRDGFSLLELIVVAGLVGAIFWVFAAGGMGRGHAASLHAAQSILLTAVTTARAQAIASGREVRLLVHHGLLDAVNFRRRIILVQPEAGGWVEFTVVDLPDGVALAPYRTRLPTGFYPRPEEWRTASGAEPLGSSGLSNPPMFHTHAASSAVEWEYVTFTPRGTVDGAGSLVLLMVRPAGPQPAAGTASPCVAIEPRLVRGLQVSVYGAPRLIHDRTGF